MPTEAHPDNLHASGPDTISFNDTGVQFTLIKPLCDNGWIGASRCIESSKLKYKSHFRNVPSRDITTLRADRRSGAELIEFTLALLPLFAMLFVLLDLTWMVFVQATVVRAVRVAVRTGITLTAAQMGTGACLTDTVKGIVQQNGLGFLKGASGLAYIKVNYYLPPPPGTTTAATNVSTLSSGNAPGNIIQVSVNNYSLPALLPRIFSWNQAPDSSAFVFTSSSADLIEPSSNPPCIGTAP